MAGVTLGDAKMLFSQGLIDEAELNLIMKAGSIVDTTTTGAASPSVVATTTTVACAHGDLATRVPQEAYNRMTKLRGSPRCKRPWSSLAVGIDHMKRAWNEQVHERTSKRRSSERQHKRRRFLDISHQSSIDEPLGMKENPKPKQIRRHTKLLRKHGNLVTETIQCLRNALPIFAFMPTYILEHVIMNSRGVSKVGYCAGEQIVRMHEAEPTAQVVCEGEVEVELAHGSSTAERDIYGPGYVFGTNSLLTGAAQTTTVVAGTDVTVLEVNREKLKGFFLSCIKNDFLHFGTQREVRNEAPEGKPASNCQIPSSLSEPLPPFLRQFACQVQSSIHRLNKFGSVLNDRQNADITKMSGIDYMTALGHGGLGQQNDPVNFFVASSRQRYCQQQKLQLQHSGSSQGPSEIFTPLNELYQIQYREDLMHQFSTAYENDKRNCSAIILQGKLHTLETRDTYDTFYGHLLDLLSQSLYRSNECQRNCVSKADSLGSLNPSELPSWLTPFSPVLATETVPPSSPKSTPMHCMENVKAMAAQVLLAVSRCAKDRSLETGGEGHGIVQTICSHPAVIVQPSIADVRPMEITLVPRLHGNAVVMVQSSCRHVALHVDKSHRGKVAEWANFRTAVVEVLDFGSHPTNKERNFRLWSIRADQDVTGGDSDNVFCSL